jgi:hypothetical protein
MARTFGDKFLLELSKVEVDTLGTELAKVCIAANIPASYVAFALEVSTQTVHNWFRQKMLVSIKHRKVVEVFIAVVREDMKNGRLPASSTKNAKSYISSMVGREF